MKKFGLVLLAIAVISMQSCAQRQEQQSANQAQSQNRNESAPNQPNQGQPPTSNETTRKELKESQLPPSKETTRKEPKESQLPPSNESTRKQPNESQPPTSNETAPSQPYGGQPPSNESAQSQPSEGQSPTSNESAQSQASEGRLPGSNEGAPSQPYGGQPPASNESAQSRPSEGQPPASNETPQNQPNEGQPISPDNLSKNEVRQVQRALNKSGFRAGAANGRWRPETSNALKQFQQSKNIQANGKIDQETLSALGLNEAQLAQQNNRNGKSSGSRSFPSLHPSTMVNARKRFESRVTVSKWQAKSRPNLPGQTYFDGRRRHGVAFTPWRLIVPEPHAVFVGGTYAGSDPDPNIRAALRRDFGTR